MVVERADDRPAACRDPIDDARVAMVEVVQVDDLRSERRDAVERVVALQIDEQRLVAARGEQVVESGDMRLSATRFGGKRVKQRDFQRSTPQFA